MWKPEHRIAAGGRRRVGAGRAGLRGRRRAAPARVGSDDGSVATAERIVVVGHLLSSLIAHSSIWSSGQSPAKCMPIALATLNSGHSGEVRSK